MTIQKIFSEFGSTNVMVFKSSRLCVQIGEPAKRAKKGDRICGSSIFANKHRWLTSRIIVQVGLLWKTKSNQVSTSAATKGVEKLHLIMTQLEISVREIYNNAANEFGIISPEIHSIGVSRTINCKGEGRVKVKVDVVKPEI